MTSSLSARLICSCSRDGISSRHGRHQVAHKLTTSSLPRKSASLMGFPSISVKATSGAGCGGVAGINSPSLVFSSSAATAIEDTSRSARRAVAHRAQKAESQANKLWGGRFESGPAAIMRRINASIDFDKRLYAEDIAGSKAHCAMLVAKNIISPEDGDAIAGGLEQIRQEIDSGSFVFSEANEDIHLNIEARLAELIGPAAGRLHTARSRNDQVATDFRLWVRGAIDSVDQALGAYQQALAEKALQHAATVMPGFTHLQIAQPITFGHHLLAYVEMAARDRGRFADARKRANQSPLGAAALAGTAFPVDRAMTAKTLGFEKPMANSLDAVSDRDFVLEALSAAAITAVHLSRFAEEIVIWCSPLVGLIALSDRFTTGSSI